MNAQRTGIDWVQVKQRVAAATEQALDRVLHEDPARVEAVYARRAAALADRAAVGGASAPQERVPLLVFRLGQQHYGLAMSDVVRVMRLAACVPVPGGPAELLGVMNIAGEARSVLDLGIALRSGDPRDDAADGHVLIVRAARQFAVRVDEVLAAAHATADELEALDDPAAPVARYARGRTAGGVVVLSAALLHDGLLGRRHRPAPSGRGVPEDQERDL